MMKQAMPGEPTSFDSDRGCRLAEPPAGQAQKPRLLDRVRMVIRSRNLSPRTEETYVAWIRKYILFHAKRRPADLGEAEIAVFLSSLATGRRVSASTQNQALSALLFLYQEVLHKDLEWLHGIVRAKRPIRVPVVLTKSEVEAILAGLEGAPWLMASLLYGAGLRLMECCRLRVKDLDLQRNEIRIRDGKGLKDRVTLVPGRLRGPLAAHPRRCSSSTRAICGWASEASSFRAPSPASIPLLPASGAGSGSSRPPACTSTARPACCGAITCLSPYCSGPSRTRSGRRASPSGPVATLSGTRSPPTSWRQATTTMIYTHVLNRGGRGVRSPLG